jgi:hypothetical protein
MHGFGQVFGNAVGAAEIIEGTLRQDAEYAALVDRRMGDRVQGAVAARRYQDAAGSGGPLRHARGDCVQFGRFVHDLEFAAASGLVQHLPDRRAAQLGFGMAGAGIQDDIVGCVGVGHRHAAGVPVELRGASA